MKKSCIRTYLELAVPRCLFRMELEPLEVCNPLVICKEVLPSAFGFIATTPAFVIALFVLLVTLNPIPDPNVGRESSKQWLPMLLEVILTLYGIIPIISEGCKPIKVTANKQIMCTADHIPPPQTIGFVLFICMIHHTNKGFHTSLQPSTTWVRGQQFCWTISIAPHPITYRMHCTSGDHFQ